MIHRGFRAFGRLEISVGIFHMGGASQSHIYKRDKESSPGSPAREMLSKIYNSYKPLSFLMGSLMKLRFENIFG